MMKLLNKLSVVVFILPFVLLFNEASLAGPTPQTIELGTATPGGGFELFGNTLAAVVNKVDAPVKLKPIATRGSKQNLNYLAQGKIVLGLVEGNAARQALAGIGRDKLDLKVLSVMYPNPGMFVVRADTHYQSIDDLKGKPIAFGTRASGLRILVGDVLNALGLDPAKDFQQIILDKAAQGPKLVLENKAEALWGAGIGWPGFVKVADSSIGARFIAPSQSQIGMILKKHPHLKKMTVPVGTYKGQDKAIHSIGLWSLILISPTVSEDIAYDLAKAIHQSEAMMADKLEQGRFTTASNTINNVDINLLHPGVVKYYREQKLISIKNH